MAAIIVGVGKDEGRVTYRISSYRDVHGELPETHSTWHKSTTKSYAPLGPTVMSFLGKHACKSNVQVQNSTITTVRTIVKHIEHQIQHLVAEESRPLGGPLQHTHNMVCPPPPPDPFQASSNPDHPNKPSCAQLFPSFPYHETTCNMAVVASISPCSTIHISLLEVHKDWLGGQRR